MVKVAAMAAIGTASLLGAAPPVLRRRTRSPGESESYYLFRAFTSGILLSLAFIHVIADGFEKLEGLSGDVPAAPILVLAGIMLMFIVERASLDLFAGGEHPCCHQHAHAGRAADIEQAYRRRDAVLKSLEDLGNEGARTFSAGAPGALQDAVAHDVEASEGHGHGHSHGGGHTHCDSHEHHKTSEGKASAGCCGHGSAHAHTHAHSRKHTNGDLSESLLHGAAASTEELATQAVAGGGVGGGVGGGGGGGGGRNQENVMLSMLEIGIIVHSVAIGLDVGASDAGASTSIGYIVALCFHQFFEGLGLGTMIAAAMEEHPRGGLTSGAKAALMVGFFAVTLPAGILIGMLLRGLPTFLKNSPPERWLIGGLDCVSGGILVYICLCGCGALVNDFTRPALMSPAKMCLRWKMIGAMFVGMGIMAVLGLWA
jgi:hypothetical protein